MWFFVLCGDIGLEPIKCNSPVDCCGHQFKNWWRPYNLPHRGKLAIESYIVTPLLPPIYSDGDLFFVNIRTRTHQMQMSSGHLRQPVQKLVAPLQFVPTGIKTQPPAQPVVVILRV